jgi:hypothetical protein
MNKLFINFLNSEKPKFTVIIGSGFHKEFLARLKPNDSRFNKLKDWRCLIDFLKKIELNSVRAIIFLLILNK